MASLSPASDRIELETDERDYSERLGDVLGDSDDEESDASDSEGGFVYDGEDAEASGPYREQLSEILEQPIDELDELEDKHHVQTLLLRDAPSPPQSEEFSYNIEPETVCTPVHVYSKYIDGILYRSRLKACLQHLYRVSLFGVLVFYTPTYPVFDQSHLRRPQLRLLLQLPDTEAAQKHLLIYRPYHVARQNLN